MPSVFVVPVYVEVPAGFERAIMTLETILRRAGYEFCFGEPRVETLEATKQTLRISDIEHDRTQVQMST